MNHSVVDTAERAAFPTRIRAKAFWLWMLQRLTGLLLVYFVGLHLVTLHALRTGPIDAAGIAERVRSSPFLVGFYAVFVAVVVVHAAIGVRSVTLDYGSSPRGVRLVDTVMLAVAVIMTGYGLLVLSDLLALS